MTPCAQRSQRHGPADSTHPNSSSAANYDVPHSENGATGAGPPEKRWFRNLDRYGAPTRRRLRKKRRTRGRPSTAPGRRSSAKAGDERDSISRLTALRPSRFDRKARAILYFHPDAPTPIRHADAVCGSAEYLDRTPRRVRVLRVPAPGRAGSARPKSRTPMDRRSRPATVVAPRCPRGTPAGTARPSDRCAGRRSPRRRPSPRRRYGDRGSAAGWPPSGCRSRPARAVLRTHRGWKRSLQSAGRRARRSGGTCGRVGRGVSSQLSLQWRQSRYAANRGQRRVRLASLCRSNRRTSRARLHGSPLCGEVAFDAFRAAIRRPEEARAHRCTRRVVGRRNRSRPQTRQGAAAGARVGRTGRSRSFRS